MKVKSIGYEPFGSLSASLDSGEGEVRILETFDDWDELTKLDVLKDWIGILQTEYDQALDKWGREKDWQGPSSWMSH